MIFRVEAVEGVAWKRLLGIEITTTYPLAAAPNINFAINFYGDETLSNRPLLRLGPVVLKSGCEGKRASAGGKT